MFNKIPSMFPRSPKPPVGGASSHHRPDLLNDLSDEFVTIGKGKEKVDPDEGRPRPDRSALTFSQLEEKSLEERTMSGYVNEFRGEIAKTVLIRNIPFEIGADQIAAIANKVKGGVRMIKFYPKGGRKSALVEFNSYEGLNKKFAEKIEALGEGIRAEPSKLCIKEALTLELRNATDRVATLEEQLAELRNRMREREGELRDLEHRNQELEGANRRLARNVEIEVIAKRNADARIAALEEQNARLREETKNHRTSMRKLKRDYNIIKLRELVQNEKEDFTLEELQGLSISGVTMATTTTSGGDPSNGPPPPLFFLSNDGGNPGVLPRNVGGLPSNNSRTLTKKQLQDELAALQEEEQREMLVERAEQMYSQKMALKRQKAEAYAIVIAKYWRDWARRQSEIRREEELTMKFLQEEQLMRQKENERKQYTCPICFCDYTIDQMYTLDNCFHRFCFECLGEYLRVKITEGQVRDIICPDPKCKEIISPPEIKHCVDEELFSKYEDFSLQAALNTMEDLRWCPKVGCSNAMIGDKSQPMMVCSNPECKFTFCFNCKEEWHADASCEQYQQWKIENSEADARYQQWVQQHAKSCPKCKSPIEKNGGCNHMTCQHCKHEFCWLCMAEYKPEHWNDNKTGCKQFT